VKFENLPSNLRVFVCRHVFENSRSVNYVVHEDGDFSFLCGESDHKQSAEDFFAVGLGHIIERDSSLRQIGSIPDSHGAERNADGKWFVDKLG